MLPSVFSLTWLQWFLVALAFTQTTIFCVTLHLHRSQAHRALDLHPALAHLMRFWLWLSTAMSTREWVAVHRKHHAHCETVQDPHSPKHFGLATVLFTGARLYAKEVANPETVERYGRGAPNDWLERNVYTRLKTLGPVLMTGSNVALFGVVQGLLLSAVQFVWIPAWAAGVINGLAHAKGYRNFATNDESRNLLPWGLWIGGEELHNNHHAHATSAKLSYHWWEVDIGWGAIRVLKALGLAKVKKVVRPPELRKAPALCTPDLVRVLGQHQMLVSRWYHGAWARALTDLRKSEALTRGQVRLLRKMWHETHPSAALHKLVGHHKDLSTMRSQWAELQGLWTNRRASAEELAVNLARWCERAERSGVDALSSFSLQLRRLPAG